jgi:hypothetical protein
VVTSEQWARFRNCHCDRVRELALGRDRQALLMKYREWCRGKTQPANYFRCWRPNMTITTLGWLGMAAYAVHILEEYILGWRN